MARRRPSSALVASDRHHLPGIGGTLGLGSLLAGAGVLAAVAAVALDPAAAAKAAGQDWPPFVLVAGLLLVGLVADDDRLFAAAGDRLARASRSNAVLFAGAAVMVGVVTAILNLDTSVAFLTPVLVYTARSRRQGEAALLYGCILLSNAGSLLLPGSNLTNLIVLGHPHLTGAAFAARMWPSWIAALVVTAAVVAVAERRELRRSAGGSVGEERPVLGLGLGAVVAVTAIVVALPSPALPVAAVGVVAVVARIAGRRRESRQQARQAIEVLGLPVLTGLFSMAVALGTLARAWSGPSDLMSHLNGWATAAVAAVASVLVNNLPAASLLAARTPRNPLPLLIGLNLGPNLFVTGSLAWVLWLRAARAAGAKPSVARAARLGLVAAPLSIAAALAALTLTSPH